MAVAIPKILSFYLFRPLADPEALRLWQRDLGTLLDIRGRILLSPQGINAAVGGDLPNVKRYLRTTREYAPFRDVEPVWGEGTGLDFPRLSVRVRDELVSFGSPGELKVDGTGVIGGGTRLSPREANTLAESEDVTFFDGRNRIETAIGRFDDALVADVGHTNEFVAELDSGRYDHLKDTPVVTYCTGGIRCEVLSSLMINRGFTRVYQLDGGILRYGHEFGDGGLWNGSLYVFDERKSVDFSDDTVRLGRCHRCSIATNLTANCSEPSCRQQVVACSLDAHGATCSVHENSLAASSLLP